jgi:hypothetical protein
MHCKSNYS